MEDLCDVYENLEDLKVDLEKVNLPRKTFSNKQQLFFDKIHIKYECHIKPYTMFTPFSCNR